MNLRIEFDADGLNPDQAADVVRWIADMVEDGYTSGPVSGADGRPIGDWTFQ